MGRKLGIGAKLGDRGGALGLRHVHPVAAGAVGVMLVRFPGHVLIGLRILSDEIEIPRLARRDFDLPGMNVMRPPTFLVSAGSATEITDRPAGISSSTDVVVTLPSVGTFMV
jgi:hypothetical protein